MPSLACGPGSEPQCRPTPSRLGASLAAPRRRQVQAAREERPDEVRRVLEPLDGRREHHAAAHLQELEPAAVRDALGMEHVLVAAEVLDWQRIRRVCAAAYPLQRFHVGPGLPLGHGQEILPQTRVVDAVEPRRATPYRPVDLLVPPSRELGLDGRYGVCRPGHGPDERQLPRPEGEMGHEERSSIGLFGPVQRVGGSAVRPGSPERGVLEVQREDGVWERRGRRDERTVKLLKGCCS